MTTPILVLTYTVAAMAIFGIFAGIPLWMVRRHPDTAPDNRLPDYLRATWETVPGQSPASAGRRAGR